MIDRIICIRDSELLLAVGLCTTTTGYEIISVSIKISNQKQMEVDVYYFSREWFYYYCEMLNYFPTL